MVSASRPRKRRRQAITLLEVVIALLIVAFVSLGFMGSMVFMLKQNSDNKRQMAAVEAASYYQGLLFAANPRLVGDPSPADGSYEARFNHGPNNPLKIYMDPSRPRPADEITVHFEFSGFGSIAEATETTLRADFPSNQRTWETNQWAGSYVVVESTLDTAKSQVMRIISNTADTLTVTADLTGSQSVEWQTLPDDTYTYHINNGRTVTLVVSWGDGQDYRTIRRSVILPRRG